ncbi:hypothetical protein CPB85DRAFT_1255042 [Mucidula mucida]|nr:hypothetical protein CPB85DRAFT_1255042 [Mucidula mucida]
MTCAGVLSPSIVLAMVHFTTRIGESTILHRGAAIVVRHPVIHLTKIQLVKPQVNTRRTFGFRGLTSTKALCFLLGEAAPVRHIGHSTKLVTPPPPVEKNSAGE